MLSPHVFAAKDALDLPPLCLGFIYWPAVVGVAAGSLIFVPLGARLAKRVKQITLKRVLAGFILLAALRMIADVLH